MWKQINKYFLQNGSWTISKSYIRDIPKYSLFDDGKRIDGVFDSSDDAIKKYEELNR